MRLLLALYEEEIICKKIYRGHIEILHRAQFTYEHVFSDPHVTCMPSKQCLLLLPICTHKQNKHCQDESKTRNPNISTKQKKCNKKEQLGNK